MRTHLSIFAYVCGFWVCLFLIAYLESGCSVLPHLPKKPFKVTTLAGTAVTQSNDVKEPAKTDTRTEETSAFIPAGSNITFDEKVGVMSVHLSKDMSLIHKVSAEKIQAPTPSLPASPREVALASADGQSRLWAYGISGAMFLGACLLLYIGHAKAGIFLIAGAVGLPILSFVVQALVAYVWAVVCVAVAGAFVWAWYSIRHYHPEFLGELKAQVVKVEAKISEASAKI